MVWCDSGVATLARRNATRQERPNDPRDQVGRERGSLRAGCSNIQRLAVILDRERDVISRALRVPFQKDERVPSQFLGLSNGTMLKSALRGELSHHWHADA